MTPREAFIRRVGVDELEWRDIEWLANVLGKTEVVATGCWIWLGSQNRGGYGVAYPPRMGKGNSPRLAHRVVWTLLGHGSLGDLTLDHLCENKLCVNPGHLEAVSLEENVRRGWQREEQARRNRNREKTACPSGHPYDDSNTYTREGGGRVCRTCVRERQARRRAEEPELIKEIKRRSYHRNAERAKEKSREYRRKKKLLEGSKP